MCGLACGPRLRTCCCCATVRTGSQIIATLCIVEALLTLVGIIIWTGLSYYPYDLTARAAIAIAVAIYVTMMITVNVGLLYGIEKNKPVCLLVWLVLLMIRYVVSTI